MSAEQRAQIDALMRQGGIGGSTVAEMRRGFEVLMSRMPVPEGIRTEASDLGGRPAVHVTPAKDGREGTILYFHGGSYMVGSPSTAMGLTGNLVIRSGFESYSVDYRLAPEHPLPAAFEDGLAAYRDLLERGVAPATVAFAGDSAGGGLSVATALLARDAGLPLPAAVVLFSPGLDATRSGESYRTKVGIDPVFTPEALNHTAEVYLAGQDPRQPLYSPATTADLTGFPPLLVQVGANELLLDDSVRIARRALDAGVDVVLDVTAGVPHVFQSFTGMLDEADEALDRASLFLTQHLGQDAGSARRQSR